MSRTRRISLGAHGFNFHATLTLTTKRSEAHAGACTILLG